MSRCLSGSLHLFYLCCRFAWCARRSRTKPLTHHVTQHCRQARAGHALTAANVHAQFSLLHASPSPDECWSLLFVDVLTLVRHVLTSSPALVARACTATHKQRAQIVPPYPHTWKHAACPLLLWSCPASIDASVWSFIHRSFRLVVSHTHSFLPHSPHAQLPTAQWRPTPATSARRPPPPRVLPLPRVLPPPRVLPLPLP